MLGIELQRYGFNKIPFFILAAVALLAGYAAWDVSGSRNPSDQEDFIIFGITAAIAAAWAFTISRAQVVLHQDGLCAQNLFGRKEMRWDEVERFYYSATQRSVNFIPIGTYYSLKLHDASGKKISIGTSVGHCRDLGQKIIAATMEPLLKKLIDRFNAGQQLDFGPIQVSRQNGITVKKTIGKREIPWDKYHSYSLDGGKFYIFSITDKLVFGPDIGQVPNAFVLSALLDTIVASAQEPAASQSFGMSAGQK